MTTMSEHHCPSRSPEGPAGDPVGKESMRPSRLASDGAGGSSGRPAPEPKVTLRLTQSQVAEVCASAARFEGSALAAIYDGEVLARLDAIRDRLVHEPNIRVSHTLVRGFVILAALPNDGETVGVLQVARRLELNPSTTHRYLHTLVVLGLARQDEETREYGRAQTRGLRT
jgi:hypothetical protein